MYIRSPCTILVLMKANQLKTATYACTCLISYCVLLHFLLMCTVSNAIHGIECENFVGQISWCGVGLETVIVDFLWSLVPNALWHTLALKLCCQKQLYCQMFRSLFCNPLWWQVRTEAMQKLFIHYPTGKRPDKGRMQQYKDVLE